MATEIVNGRNAAGTTDERPTNVDAGFTYWNSEAGKQQTFTGSEWVDIGGPGVAAPAAKSEDKDERKARKR